MNSTLLNQTNKRTSPSLLEQQTYPAVYSLFFIISFPANFLSLFVAWKLMLNGNSMAVYLVTLSISDLLYTITLPVWIEMALDGQVSDIFCGVLYLIMYNSFYVGSGLLCCISVDRYLAVVHPLHFIWVRKVSTAALVSTAVWILEILVHILLLHYMGVLESFQYLCHQHIPMTELEANVALTRVVLGFMVPLVIMIFCFLRIMRSLRKNSSMLGKERRKVGRLLLLLLLTYVASFVPFQMVMLLRAILEPHQHTWAESLRDPYLVTVATTTLNSTMDPIIYCLINESAKREILKAVENGKNSFKRRWM